MAIKEQQKAEREIIRNLLLYINKANFISAAEGWWGRELLNHVKWKNCSTKIQGNFFWPLVGREFAIATAFLANFFGFWGVYKTWMWHLLGSKWRWGQDESFPEKVELFAQVSPSKEFAHLVTPMPHPHGNRLTIRAIRDPRVVVINPICR